MARINHILWRNAQHDAAIIMGREDRPRGRPRLGENPATEWKADSDPLAWWCLVELLVSYAQGKKS